MSSIVSEANVQMVKDVMKSMTVEFAIFAVTLVCAFIVNFLAVKPVKKMEDDLPAKEAEVGEEVVHVSTALHDRTPPVVRRPFNNKKRDASELIYDMMNIMKEQPGLRSAGQVIQMYSELRTTLYESESHDGLNRFHLLNALKRADVNAIDLYTTLVHCAVRSGQACLVDKIINDMVAQSVPRTLAFYESTMKQLAGQKQYKLALYVYDVMTNDGLKPGPVTMSCLIGFAAELGDHVRAVDFFNQLSLIQNPSIRAYMTILRLHSKRQDWRSSIATFRDMQKQGLAWDTLALNVVLATGVAAEQLQEVEALLAEAELMTPPRSDVVSYNTLLGGYARCHDVTAVSTFIARLRKRGFEPNTITFNTVINAVVQDQNFDEAWKIFKEMRRSNVHPDKYTCSTLVKTVSKAPTAERVEAALGLMEEAGGGCHAVLRSSLCQTLLSVAAKFSQEKSYLTRARALMNPRHTPAYYG